MVIDKMIKCYSNLAFHLLQDVRDNLIGPFYHKTKVGQLDNYNSDHQLNNKTIS